MEQWGGSCVSDESAPTRIGTPGIATLSTIGYTGCVQFVWDPNKAEANLKAHGVDFREAATAFDDPLSTTFPDIDHSVGERRFLIIGMSALNRILVVSHTEDGDTIRIISARTATRPERRFYEEDESDVH